VAGFALGDAPVVGYAVSRIVSEPGLTLSDLASVANFAIFVSMAASHLNGNKK
jgi:hypothetical protein